MWVARRRGTSDWISSWAREEGEEGGDDEGGGGVGLVEGIFLGTWGKVRGGEGELKKGRNCLIETKIASNTVAMEPKGM